MKVKIEIEYEIDGNEPLAEDVVSILHARITGVLLSEEVGKPDEWALLPVSNDIHILANIASQTDAESGTGKTQ